MAGTQPRTSHQSRLEWWRAQFQRQRRANLNVTEFCRHLGVSVTTFYYWKKRVDETPLAAPKQDPGVSRWPCATAANNFIPVTILEPAAPTELEIELTNSCVLRLKGVIDPSLLEAAITAAGQLDGSRQGGH
jgi:hypothetical protein